MHVDSIPSNPTVRLIDSLLAVAGPLVLPPETRVLGVGPNKAEVLDALSNAGFGNYVKVARSDGVADGFVPEGPFDLIVAGYIPRQMRMAWRQIQNLIPALAPRGLLAISSNSFGNPFADFSVDPKAETFTDLTKLFADNGVLLDYETIPQPAAVVDEVALIARLK